MSNDAKDVFAHNLKYYLTRNGKTQRDLVEYLNVSSSTVSDWCSGIKYPRVDKMQRIADWFGITMSVLTSSDADRLAAITLSSSESSLLSSYRELNEEGQEKAADYIEDLCASGRYKKCGSDGVAAKEA